MTANLPTTSAAAVGLGCFFVLLVHGLGLGLGLASWFLGFGHSSFCFGFFGLV